MAQRTDLDNVRVIVTRPQQQADTFCMRLREFGFDYVAAPVLALQAVTGQEQVQAVKNVVLDFDRYQKAIFVSQNAVGFALHWLENYWPQLPQGIQYFAVGETTAKQLQSYGVPVSALTASSSGAMNSESLLQSPELQAVRGENVVIFRGCGGRGQMADVLRARGATVTYCELYERIIPTQAEQQLRVVFGDMRADVAHREKHLVVALHSGESLENFLAVVTQMRASNAGLGEMILQLPVLVPGQRVAGLAKDAGFSAIIVAENATDTSMIAALLNANNNRQFFNKECKRD